MITKKIILMAALAGSMLLPIASQAFDLQIDLGDRGYYTHGRSYYRGDYEYVWVPGHREHHRWVHGYYRRGERRHHHWDRR